MLLEARSIISKAFRTNRDVSSPQGHERDRDETSKRREIQLESFDEVLKLVPNAKIVIVQMALLQDPTIGSFSKPRLTEGSRFVIEDGSNLYTFNRLYKSHAPDSSLRALRRRDLDVEEIRKAAGEETVIINEQDKSPETQWKRFLLEIQPIPASEVLVTRLNSAGIREVVSSGSVRRIPRSPAVI